MIEGGERLLDDEPQILRLRVRKCGGLSAQDDNLRPSLFAIRISPEKAILASVIQPCEERTANGERRSSHAC